MITQLRHGAMVLATALATACSDASAPPPPHMGAGSALARHMDSLVVAAKSNPRDSLWAAVVGGAEYVPAYGGAPTSVTVQTNSGTETWQTLLLAEAYPGQDTSYFLWAYSDSAFTKVLVTGSVIAPQTGGSTVVSYLIVNDTLLTTVAAFTVITPTSVGDHCTFTFGLVNVPNAFAVGTCALGTFTAKVAVFGGDTLSIPTQPVTGVILN